MQNLPKHMQKHWIVKQLESSSDSPTQRLLSFFEMLQNLPEVGLVIDARDELLQYLTVLAKSSNIHHPEFFAQQIYFMATEAFEKQRNHPDSDALKHARIAAKALLNAQKKNHFRRHSPIYAMAASFFMVVGASGVMFGNLLNSNSAEQLATAEPQLLALVETNNVQIDNPIRITEMLSQRDKMREGRCQFPEALVFSETERGIYLQNVVHGEISANREVQEVSSRLREFVRCDYTPMLMKKSVG